MPTERRMACMALGGLAPTEVPLDGAPPGIATVATDQAFPRQFGEDPAGWSPPEMLLLSLHSMAHAGL